MRTTRPAPILLLLLAACAGAGGDATADPRVRSLRGQVPPEMPADVVRLDGAPASLASLRGRVVYLQLAFPT